MFDWLKDKIENVLYRNRAPSPKPLPSDLLNNPDVEIGKAAVNGVINALDKAKGDSRQKMMMLSPEWRAINTLFTLDYQVCNGGFHQFFTNSGGEYDAILLDDLAVLGESAFVPIVRTAFESYRKLDYTDQWENCGKSWEYFTAPYKEGRFKTDDKAYYAVKPKMMEQIGFYVRNNFQKLNAT
jgi:hypothetical protein